MFNIESRISHRLILGFITYCNADQRYHVSILYTPKRVLPGRRSDKTDIIKTDHVELLWIKWIFR